MDYSLPGAVVKNLPSNVGDMGSTPRLGRSPRKGWQPIPVFLPGESHGQRNPVCHRFSSKEQVSFNSVAVVTICSDFGAQENKVCSISIFPPSIFHEVMGQDSMI